MKHFIILLAGLLLPLVQRTTASPAPHLQRRYGEVVVHEKRGFNDELDVRGEPGLRRRLESHITIPLRFALKQGNLDTLPGHLLSVSDPSSSSYGQHWTHERIVKAFAPSPQAHETVRSWLVNVGGFEESRVIVSKNGGWVSVVGGATVAEAEKLLMAEYHVFARDDGDDVVGEYMLLLLFSTLLFFHRRRKEIYAEYMLSRMPKLLLARQSRRARRFRCANRTAEHQTC